ncbi:MAG: YceD family protein [Alphaproteobacteria bacterium]
MTTDPDAVFSHRIALKPGAEARPVTARTADADERAAVTALLAIDAVEDLTVEARLETVDGVFRCRGEVRARVVQACVVTGRPVVQEVAAGFERFLVVGAAPAAAAAIDVDPDERDVDYLDAPVVDIGAIAVEELALALDPYPRAADADAVLAASNAATDDAAARRPFAVLARKRVAS